jgi:glycerol uptake facilitator protein
MINWGWGLAVFAGVLVSAYSGAQLNPAVDRLLIAGKIGVAQFFVAIAAQLVGAFIGAVLCWLAYKQHFDEEPDAATKLGVFSTGPAIRSYGWNLVTEIIGTFVLVFVIFAFADYGDVRSAFPEASARSPPSRRPPRGRHRRLARWPDRLRHQPRP